MVLAWGSVIFSGGRCQLAGHLKIIAALFNYLVFIIFFVPTPHRKAR